jgi:arsenate reductase
MTMTTIYHNPDCGTSRNTLAMIRQSGVEPTVIEYLKTPPDRATIIRLVGDSGLTLRQALRQKDTPFDALGLGDPSKSDADLLDAIEAHPMLLNRPFVVTAIGTRLCRPSELVLEVLENPAIGEFVKEDGEVVPAQGKRVD